MDAPIGEVDMRFRQHREVNLFDRQTKGYVVTTEIRVIKSATLADVATIAQEQSDKMLAANEEVVMESALVRVVEIDDEEED